MAKVAIITRTKDRALLLKRAIHSVQSQTYTDYVHVIVNDGGGRESIESILRECDELTRSRIKVFHRDLNSNAPDTIFNESIDRVDSEYVAVHDDDDTWHERFLEHTVKALDSGAQGVVARANKVVERINGGRIQKKTSEHYLPDMKAVSLYRQCIDNQLTPIAFIFRRDAYEAIEKYDNELPVAADWEFGIRFLCKYDVEYIDPGYALAFYHFRENGDNTSKKHDYRRHMTQVYNRYLRDELSSGKLGVGYIMSSLRYEQDMMTSVVRKLVPKPIAKIIRKKVRS